MALFKTLARMAIQKLADNPELRTKVASVVKEDIVPRAKEGWEQAKPELKKAKEQLKEDCEENSQDTNSIRQKFDKIMKSKVVNEPLFLLEDRPGRRPRLGTLSREEWEAITLYRVFAFKKK